MESFRKKNNLIQTYGLIAIDVICVLISYIISFFIRYQGSQHLEERDYFLCLLLVLFCFFYNFILDWNHFIFKRGYFDELVAVFKYSISMTIFWGFSIFVMRQGEMFSRMVFGVFAILNIVLTYVAHTLFKKYLYKYYKRSNNSDKVIVVTNKEWIKEVLEDIKEAKEWSYDIVAIALLDESCSDSVVEGIPVVASGSNFIEEIKQMMMDAAFIYLPHLKKDKLKYLGSDPGNFF